MDPYFNRTTALSGLATLGAEYTHEKFAEALTINALAATLIAAAVVMSVIVMYPKFRSRPQTHVAVANDRYG